MLCLPTIVVLTNIGVSEFVGKNHTATQSSFNEPCSPLGNSTGFDSGFKPVTAGDLIPQLFNITVSDTAPIWVRYTLILAISRQLTLSVPLQVYCRQSNPMSHCGAGMVFSVNAVETGANNFNNFQAKAMQQNGSTNSTTATQSGSALTQHPSVFVGLVSAFFTIFWASSF